MKIKNICKFAAVVTLPFALISCDKKEEESPTSGSSKEATSKSHTEIGKQVSTAMFAIMTEMSSIDDVDTAKAFTTGLKGHKETLKGLLSAAKSLDPPTAEEKAAVQEMKEKTDAQGDAMMAKMMETMSTNPNAEEIGKVMQEAMQDEEMDQITDELKDLYALED